VSPDSFSGPVRVEWDREAAQTLLGQLPFFVDFLKGRLVRCFRGGLSASLSKSERAEKTRRLGTAMLSILIRPQVSS
jgi:hypothetical protein